MCLRVVCEAAGKRLGDGKAGAVARVGYWRFVVFVLFLPDYFILPDVAIQKSL